MPKSRNKKPLLLCVHFGVREFSSDNALPLECFSWQISRKENALLGSRNDQVRSNSVINSFRHFLSHQMSDPLSPQLASSLAHESTHFISAQHTQPRGRTKISHKKGANRQKSASRLPGPCSEKGEQIATREGQLSAFAWIFEPTRKVEGQTRLCATTCFL